MYNVKQEERSSNKFILFSKRKDNHHHHHYHKIFKYRLKQSKELIKGHDVYIFHILDHFHTSLICRSNALLLATSSFSWCGDNRKYSLDLCGLRFTFEYSLSWRLSNNTFKVRGTIPIFSSVPVKRIFVLYSLRVLAKWKHSWITKALFIPLTGKNK